MMNKARNHSFFWKTLHEICQENEIFKNALSIHLIGKVDLTVNELVEKFDLTKNVEFIAYVNHNEVFSIEQQASLLFLPINNSPNAKGVITGKIFEYLGAKRPILCIGPKDGDAAAIINEAKAGYVVDFDDEQALKNNLLEAFELFQKNNLEVQSEGISIYSRKALTQKLTALLNEISQ